MVVKARRLTLIRGVGRYIMNQEIINTVEIMGSGKLLLILESGGHSEYEHIYRAAAGVYWDQERKGFHSNEEPKGWSYTEWFAHIVSVVDMGLDVKLKLGTNINWVNIPQNIKDDILREFGRA